MQVGLCKTELDTPVLWVDLDALEGSITHLAGVFRAAGVGWRPHTKGIKVPTIAHFTLDAGALGVTCAKLGEAEVMAAAGIRDILIANQIVAPHKIARLVGLRRHADVKVAVDHTANVSALGRAGTERGVELGVVVEVDISGVVSFATSAEHGTLTLDAPNRTLEVSDTIDFLVGYGDETVCLHDTLLGLREGRVETVWPILGRGKVR